MAISFLVPQGRNMKAVGGGLPGAALNGLPGMGLDGLPGAALNGTGLGADAAILDHNRVPFRGSPVFLRLVNTLNKAADYAAGGFHVSVDRGLAGGCKDAFTIHASGTKGATCKFALNRADVRAAWQAAAVAYFNAFFSTTDLAAGGRKPLADVKAMLNSANKLADVAFGLEGVEPPRDPGPAVAGEPPRTGEAAVAYRDKYSVGQKVAMSSAVGLGAFGLIGLISAWTKKRRNGSSWM